ncbi:MAG: S24/S26 family peptidase, partial [Flavobacteriaceae bacterium]
AANFGEDFFYIDKKSIKSNYIIPAFKHKKVDFLIQIEDNSMYPKHSCGDLVACKILKEPLFLQWNKVHVVSTKEQGILVKRIHQSSKGNFKMVSDNNEYLPFIVPKKQILGIALVVGVIRSE